MTRNSREHIARQAQHFENETKAPSGWWILPLAILGGIIWGAVSFFVAWGAMWWTL